MGWNVPNPLRRALRTSTKVAVIILIGAVIVYQIALAPVRVEVAKVNAGTVVREAMGTGTLEPRVRVSISPKITGLLTEVVVDQNDRVRKGQLLARLDDRELKQQVEVAQADLAATRAGLARAGADIVRAEATMRLAKVDFDRLSALLPTRAVSQADLDKATQQRDVAEADLNRAEAAKVEMDRQIAKAEASIRYYQARLADTQIASSLDGLVVRRLREPGDVVVPGATILEVISTKEIWVSAWVDESEVAAVSPGQPARIIFRSEPGRSYRGTVARVSQQTDRETREFLVDVTVEELPAAWAVGQRAEVYIETARKEAAVTLPQNMVRWRGAQAGVMVADAGAARWAPIVLGLRGGDVAEVTGGLTAGQSIIAPKGGGEGIRDGRAIRAREP